MLIIRFIRFFSGYVSFKASGGFCERFVNLCTLNGIPLWDMKSRDGALFAKTSVEGYKHIRQSAYRSGVRVKLEARHGLPFFLEKNKKRRGLVIGLAAAALTVFFLSTMVWTVSVEGNKKLSNTKVLSVFEELGVKKGAFRKRINTSEVAEQAEKLLPEILWASVNIRGSRVEIVICERTDAPEFPDTETPCNIVADEDGVIISIQPNIGSQSVEPGDAVLKGDLLISGVTENLDLSENLVAARGNVNARIKRSVCFDCSDKEFLTQTKEQTRYNLYFFGLRIPLGFLKLKSNLFVDESYLSNGKTVLPVGIITEHSFECTESAVIPEEYRALYNAQNYFEYYVELYGSSQIESESLSFENGNISAEIYACKDIGVRREIFVEK